MSGRGRIKGAVVREFLEWYRNEIGEADLERRMKGVRLDSIPSFDVSAYGSGVLAGSWYACADIHAMMDALADGRSKAENDEMFTAGAIAAMNETLTGLHRAVMRIVGSPDLHSRFAQRLWSTYYDSGKAESRRSGPNEQTISYSEWTSHHPLICTMTCASDKVIFPLMGLKGVEVKRVACVDGGSTHCTHKVTWA